VRGGIRQKIDRSIFPGTQGTPTLSLVAAKAVCFHLAATPKFRAVQERTLRTAALLAGELSRKGYRPVSGARTTTWCSRTCGTRGSKATRRGGLEAAGILCNRNVIPFDPESTRVQAACASAHRYLLARYGGGRGENDRRWIDQILSKPDTCPS